MGRALGHTPTAATRAEAPAFAGEGHQTLQGAALAAQTNMLWARMPQVRNSRNSRSMGNLVRFPFSRESPRSIPKEFPCSRIAGTGDDTQGMSTSKGRKVDFGDCVPVILTSDVGSPCKEPQVAF